MTQDEILSAAKEAGMVNERGETAPHWYPEIESFAKIIERKTIERCAVECEIRKFEAPTMRKEQAECIANQAVSDVSLCNLYTFQPSTEQIENRVVEACVKLLSAEANDWRVCHEPDAAGALMDAIKLMQTDAWREYLK